MNSSRAPCKSSRSTWSRPANSDLRRAESNTLSKSAPLNCRSGETSGIALPADNDRCWVVFVFHIDRGKIEGVPVENLTVGLLADTPQLMSDGNWRVGLFLDEAQPGGLRPAVETWAALAPLALPDLPEAIGRRLCEQHLLDPRRFWLPVPPPSVSAAERSFVPGRGRGWKRRYWRGPTWLNAAWMLWIGLVRLGYRSPDNEQTEGQSKGRPPWLVWGRRPRAAGQMPFPMA